MRTIAVIARKGGSGKSTVAVHLALAAHRRGRRVILADTDAQRSSSHALKGREGGGPEVVATSGAKLFALQLSAVREGVDLLVIDTPAVVEEELSHAIVAADLCLLVIRPTFLDLAAAAQTTDIVRRLRKPLVAVVNQAASARAGTEPPLVKRALKVLEMLRLPVAPALLRSRTGYQTALDLGRSVEEMDGQPEAASEVAALWSFVSGLTFGRERREAAVAQPQA
ncbi:MAG: AAA family ATPase [Phenylobacterium sp.]|uniref:AAA family ATPase n=1 Tax=Phenylobacterium sp. TaxID=1871053 RepID=UPI0025CBBDD5|nr:AAA family ATPase [Phenylobacterium sp.]MBI1197695.1 AAA family ATPase [Phenylobacterium sp.]